MSRPSALRLAGLAAIWGASFAFIKLSLEGLSPAQIVAARLGLGAVVLLVVMAVGRGRLPERAAWPHLVVLALFGAALPYFLFGWAEQRIPSALAGLLNGTTPLFTALLAVAFLPAERLGPRRAWGLALGFAGVLLVVGPGAVVEGVAGASLVAQLACLVASACYGVALVYARRIPALRRQEALPLATGQMLVAVGLMAVAAPAWAASPVRLTPPVLLAAGALGLLGTGLAYVLFFRVLIDEGATTASLVTYAVPVVAVALGVAFLGEPLTWNLLAGAAVVVGGVALMEGRFGRGGRAEAGAVDAPLPAEVD